MNQDQLDKAVARALKVILHVAEATFGTDSRWQFFRGVLLSSLNDLKRELSEECKERKGIEYAPRKHQEQ